MSVTSGIALAVARILTPLRLALRDGAYLHQLVDELGWTPSEILDASPLAPILPITSSLDALTALVQDPSAEPGAIVEQAVQLGADVFSAIDGLSRLDSSALTSWPAPLDAPETWVEIALDLPELLVLRWLRTWHPLVFATLDFTGVVKEVPRAGRPPRSELDFQALTTLLEDPPAQLRGRYAWGGDFDHALFTEKAAALMRATGLAARRSPLRASVIEAHWSGADASGVLELVMPLVVAVSPDATGELGALLAPVPGDGETTPGAVLLTTYATGTARASVALSDDWTLTAGASAQSSGGLGLVVYPDRISLAPAAVTSDVSLEIRGEPATPWALLGDPGATRLELGSVAASVEVSGSAAEPELVLALDTEGIALVIVPGEADSFLSSALGSDELRIGGACDLRWSSRTGFSIAGALGFAVTLPLDFTVGPLTIYSLSLSVSAGTSGVDAEVSTAAGFALGPFAASVEGIGLRVSAQKGARGSTSGALGAMDVSAVFKPPTGLGFAIDGQVASGGGYLYLDAEVGRYAGILDLAILGVGITAIGIITTKLPDGSDGWSMFLSLSARFTGVQLGFGFTLNGVGGLIGINRGLDVDALSDGIRTGALDAILFPDDPIADAPRILADLEAIFPVSVGQYVFGPVAQIGWGTPTLVSVDLGVVFQLPDPITISLLGSLEALLPTEDAAVLELRVDVAGTLDLTNGTLKIDASLRDSRVLGLELTGDMAVRMSFNSSPTFLLSFGGFHPDFVPPDDFPTLRRLGIALDAGDQVRISFGGYFALTSNTVQFGAEFSLYAHVMGFTAEGGASFDALIQFAPFGFDVDIEVWVSIRAGSVDLLGVLLAGSLTGPNPWHVVGSATFKVLGIRKSIEVEATFGSKRAEPPREQVNVLALLTAELARDDAWTALAPEGDGGSGALLATTGTSALELHPAGRIAVSQRVVPLGMAIEHFGNADVVGDTTFSMTEARVDGSATSYESAEEWFAAAQFFKLDAAEKLSAPSFEAMPSGLHIGDGTIEGGREVWFTTDHEVVYRDPNVRGAPSGSGPLYVAPASTRDRAVTFGAAIARRSALGMARSTKPSGAFGVKATGYVAVDERTGAALEEAPGAGYFATRTAMRGATDGTSRVTVPEHEMELLR